MSANSESFQAKAQQLFSSIELAMQSAQAQEAKIHSVKQTLDALLNALADDFVALNGQLRLLYRSNGSRSPHVNSGVAFRFHAPGRRECRYDLRVQVKRPDDLIVTATCTDYLQNHQLTVYQGGLQVQKINTALEESLLGWLEWIQQSLNG